MQIVYTNNNKLRNILGSTKDITPIQERSGIYEISCVNCDAKYIGQTKRQVSIRYKEHKTNAKNKQIHRSAIAAHIHTPSDDNPLQHNIGTFEESVRLLKTVHNERKLDAYESLYISKTTNTMNADKGNIDSPLFSLS